MNPGEVALSIIGLLLTGAFGLWAKRLDRALDLLEKIQQDTHKWALVVEHRLTYAEAKLGINFWKENGNGPSWSTPEQPR